MAYMYNYFLSKRVYDKNKIDFGKLLFSDEAIRKLLIPLIIENLLTSLMGMADSMMVTRIGSAAISAVSLTDSINVLIIQMLSALATGGAIVCSQYIGAGDIKRANAAARQVLVVVLTISSALTFVCELLNRPLLRLIFGQVEPDVMHYAVIYFLFTGFSFPFMGLYQAGAAFFRSGGDSKFPMQISIISNILNIIGNYIFIFICGWGVAGAALSTLLSRIFCALVVLAALRRPVRPIVVKNYLSIRPDFNMIQKILTIGIPAGIENSMFQFGKLAIQSSVSTLGTTSIAAQAMTVIFENLNGIAGGAIGLGLMTITGQTIGAGRREEAKYYVLKLMDIGEASIIFSCALVFAVCKPVMLLAGMEPAA
ncbi:MAG: MATE family efflux transporter, partial [Oribacterium sp.]|nr:MATE family efflux transporter [Oribacterium sp.]